MKKLIFLGLVSCNLVGKRWAQAPLVAPNPISSSQPATREYSNEEYEQDAFETDVNSLRQELQEKDPVCYKDSNGVFQCQ